MSFTNTLFESNKGYGLVAVPRSFWLKSMTALHLNQIYFKVVKLHGEKCEADEHLEDILAEVKEIAEKVRYNDPLRTNVEIILSKCPEAFRNSIRRNMEDYNDYNESSRGMSSSGSGMPSVKHLVGLHYRVIKALQVKNRFSQAKSNHTLSQQSIGIIIEIQFHYLCQ